MTTVPEPSAPEAEPGRRVVVKQDGTTPFCGCVDCGTVTRGGVKIGTWRACHRRIQRKFVPKIEIERIRFVADDGRITVVPQKWDLHAAIEALYVSPEANLRSDDE